MSEDCHDSGNFLRPTPQDARADESEVGEHDLTLTLTEDDIQFLQAMKIAA